MTLEELVGSDMSHNTMDSASDALEALVVAAQRQDCLTVGVLESAQLMNVAPDSVLLCVLATDAEDEGDVALQIHFTLLRAFCCDQGVDVVRVAGLGRLGQLLGPPPAPPAAPARDPPRDLHCVLVTTSPCRTLCSDALHRVSSYCEESRGNNQWEPRLALSQR
ncbi:growth arrest and DNA damage-inducible protein GADD45 beta-like [Gadus chalcogrammus]|uniref:growth arrest and DNA damage-inducible protein GADD45 beta-like n=1 Tax=Gadus chalcogrammus TaxID=1042646 RepID=UPI0024C3B130|nr:growth arrest and DNA damage-inducible protein GADD45 beta-like [Gadus chalcogrammus]